MSTSSLDSAAQWFALRVRPRSEKAVAESLHQKGYEEFLPLQRVRRRWSDRVTCVDLPLFPGYVFCRFDARHRLPILTTPGVTLVVSTGRHPLPVDDGEIAALRTLVESRLQLEAWPFLQVGQRIRICGGPLTAAEGILLSSNKRHRLIVSVTSLQRSVAVDIPEDCVWPTSPDTRLGA